MNKKNQFQDIVPPQKRSIRDIPLPPSRRPKDISLPHVPPQPPPPPASARPPSFSPVKQVRKSPLPSQDKDIPSDYVFGEPKTNWRPGLWLLVLIALIILFFGISYFFAGATVIVTPKGQSIDIDQNVTADKNGSGDIIPYSLISLEKEGSTEVSGNGEETVSNKASGQIIIYNAYSSNPQSLIATTRFETPEGLIFRINKDVTVPGQVTVNGQVTPGSVEATVFADEAGADYNVDLKDFTIVGFKGTAKYQGFYARSKTPLQGGFVGTMKKVSDQDLASAHAIIEKNLNQTLLAQAQAQKPDNFVLYDNSLILSFISEPNATGTKDMVAVKEKGSGYAIAFNRDVLNAYLLSHSNNNLNSASTTVLGLEDLKFTIKNQDSFNPDRASSTSLSFNLSGQVKVVSVVDQDSLKADLAGVSRGKLSSILTRYPSIEKAEVIFKPFWRWSFPDKTANIEVKIDGLK